MYQVSNQPNKQVWSLVAKFSLWNYFMMIWNFPLKITAWSLKIIYYFYNMIQTEVSYSFHQFFILFYFFHSYIGLREFNFVTGKSQQSTFTFLEYNVRWCNDICYLSSCWTQSFSGKKRSVMGYWYLLFIYSLWFGLEFVMINYLLVAICNHAFRIGLNIVNNL